MGAKHVSIRPALFPVLAVLTLIGIARCEYEGRIPYETCQTFDDLPLTPLIQIVQAGGLESPGTIKVMHGSANARIDEGDFVRVEQSVDIPSYANRATVVLNGWKSSYTVDSDRDVIGLANFIGRFRLADGKLTWNAVGVLRDNDGAEGYAWTYYYTVIAWNDGALSLRVNHDDADNFCKAGTGVSDNFYFAQSTGPDTALSSFNSFLLNPDFPRIGTVAILPRGFGVVFENDHNLLQVAYNLDHSETFVEHGKTYQKAFDAIQAPLPDSSSLAHSGGVSWTTYTIIKDNEPRRDYQFGELVSAFGGADVGVLQPPFALQPRMYRSFETCPPQASVQSEEFVIENLPFEYAIPVLTGWELRYACDDDENVKEIGIWIDAWSYEKDPADPHGRLSYKLSSVLRDRGDGPGHFRTHKVTVLGLKPVAGGGASPRGNTPD